MEDKVPPRKRGRQPKNSVSASYKVCIRDQAGSNEIRIPTWIASRLGIKPRTKEPDGSITGTKLEWSYKNSEKDSLTIKAGGAGTRYLSHRKWDTIYAVVPMGLARQYGFMDGTWVEFTVDKESRTAKITKTTPGKPPRRIKKNWAGSMRTIQDYKRQAKEAKYRETWQKSRADYLEGRLAGGNSDVSQPGYWLQALAKHAKTDAEAIDKRLKGNFTDRWWISAYFVLWAIDTYIRMTPVIKYYLYEKALPEYKRNQFMNGNTAIGELYHGVIAAAQARHKEPHPIKSALKDCKKYPEKTFTF